MAAGIGRAITSTPVTAARPDPGDDTLDTGGKVPLTLDELQLGDEAPPIEVSLGRTDFVRYAGVSGDLNPMHHDDVRAQEAGMPSVFGHGMLSAGVLASAVTGWLGTGTLTRYSVRFTKQVWPDVPLVARAVVVGRDEAAGTLDLDCRLETAAGDVVVVQAKATARLADARFGTGA